MSIETDLVAAVASLFSGRFYADFADAGTTLPFATYQQVGGETVEFLSAGAPIKRNSRIQVNVWAKTRNEANTLMRSVENLITATPFFASPIGALISRSEEITRTRGSQQDFSLWWP